MVENAQSSRNWERGQGNEMEGGEIDCVRSFVEERNEKYGGWVFGGFLCQSILYKRIIFFTIFLDSYMLNRSQFCFVFFKCAVREFLGGVL